MTPAGAFSHPGEERPRAACPACVTLDMNFPGRDMTARQCVCVVRPRSIQVSVCCLLPAGVDQLHLVTHISRSEPTSDVDAVWSRAESVNTVTVTMGVVVVSVTHLMRMRLRHFRRRKRWPGQRGHIEGLWRCIHRRRDGLPDVRQQEDDVPGTLVPVRRAYGTPRDRASKRTRYISCSRSVDVNHNVM